MNAPDFCEKAAALMRERGKQYDKPEGERSMGRTVRAFNTVTGRDGDRALTEAEGWLLQQILKDVRQWQTPTYHADSAEDCVAYAALKGEALAASSWDMKPGFPERPAEPPASTEPAKLELLPLVVGGRYRTRAGDEVRIKSEDCDSWYPFNGSNGCSYTRGGVEFIPYEGADQITVNDLVERIS